MTDFAPFLHAEIDKNAERSPSFSQDEWRASGRATKEWPNKQDQAWWLANGPQMVEAWQMWRETMGWELWEVAGRPAIELECNFLLPNEVFVKAYIDRVFVLPDGSLCVVDIKTGANLPETPAQLGVYATAIESLHGVRPTWGCFWDARKGEHTQIVPLETWNKDVLASMFEQFLRGVKSNVFLPHPNKGCGNWCSVAHACFIVGGSQAGKYDPLAQVSS